MVFWDGSCCDGWDRDGAIDVTLAGAYSDVEARWTLVIAALLLLRPPYAVILVQESDACTYGAEDFIIKPIRFLHSFHYR